MSDARFFPGIHALRAIAATLVVIEHAGYVAKDYSWISFVGPHFSYGRIGVVLFFAISGFVIALQRTNPVGVFVVHRLLRIYPSYWLAMLLAAIMLTAIGQHVSANAPSIFLYPSTSADGSLQIPYWTLAFEMTFYALAAVAFGFRLSDRALTLLALLWIVTVIIFGADAADATVYEFPGRSILLSPAVQVFPMGLICGIHFEKLRRGRRLIFLASAVLAVLLGTRFVELSAMKLFMLGISSSCLIIASADLDIRSRAIKLLGDASYGIYLMHFPAMVFAAVLWPSLRFPGLLLIGLASGAAFGAMDHKLYSRMVGAVRHITSRRPSAPVL